MSQGPDLHDRAAEFVHHRTDCSAILGMGDEDCTCGAVQLLDELEGMAKGCLTAEEAAIARALGECWNLFTQLPREHDDDLGEFRHGIHALQNIVLGRLGRRVINEGPADG